MSHTPGPWEVCGVGDGFSVVGGCGCCGSPWINGEDEQANSRLLAAAPELLAALKDMVSWPDAEVEPPHRELYEKHRAVGLAAIAKAEGQ